MAASINRVRPDLWKTDFETSVGIYNQWFLEAAPDAFQTARQTIVDFVEDLFEATDYLRNLTPEVIVAAPGIVTALRQSTAPPIARDRLAGLANCPKSLILSLDKAGRIPPKMPPQILQEHLRNICNIITQLLDRDLFEWVQRGGLPSQEQLERATVVVGDRYALSFADPAIRNEQERRQLKIIESWLQSKGYIREQVPSGVDIREMAAGTYAIHQNVPVAKDSSKTTNMPIDIVIAPFSSRVGSMPLLIEAKSAGDETNTNKRRKEEAQKFAQLKNSYGEVDLILFLTGYFGMGYLGYEAAEGIDWVWCHRVEDFEIAGV